MAALTLEITDVSRQKRARVRNVPPQSTVEEFIEGALSQLRLRQQDGHGRPLSYQAISQRQQRRLNPSEVVGDVVENGESLTLAPSIEAA